jgi:hypothetical protein
MRRKLLEELAGPASAAQLAAEAQSLSYWQSDALGYTDLVLDGFYEVHGDFPEVCGHSEFPRLAELLRVVPRTDADPGLQRREVVLVDRRYDKQLAAMRKEAIEAVARARVTSSRSSDGGGAGPLGSPGSMLGSPGGVGSPSRSRRSDSPDTAALAGGFDTLPCFQALALVVAGHMGGSLDSQPTAAEQWCAMINRLKVQTASVVVPIGLLAMGAARHRALLFKILADELRMPCRILKGRRLPGNESDNAGVVVTCSNRELYIDLLARPGAPCRGVDHSLACRVERCAVQCAMLLLRRRQCMAMWVRTAMHYHLLLLLKLLAVDTPQLPVTPRCRRGHPSA